MSSRRCRAQPLDRRTQEKSRGYTPNSIRRLRIPDITKNQKVGCPMESRSAASLRFSVQLVLVVIICFASVLGAGQNAAAANKTYNPAGETPPPPPPPVMLSTVTITACTGCSSSSFDTFPLTISTIGLSIEPGETTIIADVMAELSTQQRQHSSCVANLLLAYENTPSASPTPTNNASDISVARDANPIDITDPTTSSGTNFATEHGATGQDYNVPSGYSPLAVFPNMGTGMIAAVALVQTAAYQSLTVQGAFADLIGGSSADITDVGVGASDFAFTATTGLDATTMPMNALTPAEVVDFVAAMASASEGYHPASCY